MANMENSSSLNINIENRSNGNEKFIERLKIIIDLKEMQPSHFADEIGIQRSGLSHIIAGRNKPSVDFLEKLVRKFDDININWLLTGIGEPIIKKKVSPDKDVLEDNQNDTNLDTLPNKEKEIERIVVFYTDKTFETFNLHNPFKK